MTLIKTSLLSGIATIIRVLIGFVLNKILAVYVGPSGVAVLGQFSNYSAMLTTFGNGGINSGVTKYIAEYNEDSKKQHSIVINSLSIAFYCSLFFGLINYCFAENIAIYLFSNTQYAIIFKFFAITLVLTSLNSTLLSILNGYKQIKLFIVIGILNNVIALVMTYFLAIKYHVLGALVSLVLTQSMVCITTLLFVRSFEWFSFSFLLAKLDKAILANLSKYTLMAIVSACVVPVSQIMIRNYLAANLSLDEAGYWQAIWKISEIYLMVITTSLSTYYLPRLSEISNTEELKKEIIRGYKILLPITFVMACSIFVLRESIILVLFTPKFMPMLDLFLFQLIGDMLKIASWLLGFLILVKAMTILFIITEIIFGFSFVVLTYLFVDQFGLVGVTYAYAMNYLLHFVVMVVVIGRKIFARLDEKRY